jgi:hypothetical protein
MNQELEGKVPVADQVKEIEGVDEAIQTEYALEPDGTIVKQEELEENPETPQKQLA